jgi:CRP-like cAMP-binding protein
MDQADRTTPAPAAREAHAGSDGSRLDTHPDPDLRHEGLAAAHAAEPSRLLRALPLDEYARLLPHLTAVRLVFKQVVLEPDAPIRELWFPRTAVVSVIAVRQEGGAVEVNTVGPEGVVGLASVLGAESTPFRCIVQGEGDAWRIDAPVLRRLTEERPPLRHALLRYAQYVTDLVSQSVACNRVHTLDERCARWLLMMHDRVTGDGFEITHEFLAEMLGVRRAGVTVAMGTLQADGIVRYVRGRVTVLDRARLEAASCDCYAITCASFDRLFGGDA